MRVWVTLQNRTRSRPDTPDPPGSGNPSLALHLSHLLVPESPLLGPLHCVELSYKMPVIAPAKLVYLGTAGEL